MVPAAAVIPTPRVCVRDAAVKRSVVIAAKEGNRIRQWMSRWGARDTRARDEMPRPPVDAARRKRCSSRNQVIKDEGWRIESD